MSRFNSETGKQYGAKSSRKNVPNYDRAFINDLLSKQDDNIRTALNELFNEDKGKYLTIVCKLMDYAIPKLQSIKLEKEDEQRIITVIMPDDED